ncbi:S1C family serine protease, partial [Patescibacteria group bacterium]|nr:S1C family serine protease [Patescibacteria group bacterium]
QKKGLVWLMIIWSVVFGLIAGTVASLFILTHETIKVPFKQDPIDLTRFFPTRELKTIIEKNITVLAETRTSEVIKDLSSKTARIFKAKQGEDLGFLDQIYAPWQTEGVGLFISEDGWLITGAIFEPEIDYVVIDGENKIWSIKKIITDSFTKISFCKIEGSGFAKIELGEKDEVKSGQQVFILDKLKNFHLTEINQPQAKNIYKTEDLVYSTDYFSHTLRLDFETSITAFPQGLIFGLNEKMIGIILQEKVIPSWQIKPLIDQVLSGQENIVRPFLGIDYLRLEQAPGLTSPRFKELNKGAIVYGPPNENSPALKAGIKNADVIIKIDDIVLNQDQDLTYLIQSKAPGDEIKLTVLREDQEMIFKVVLE